MARGVAYLVFLIPIVISVPIAAYVLYDIVSQPDRELNLWPFDDSDDGHSNSITDLTSTYSVNIIDSGKYLIVLEFLDNLQTTNETTSATVHLR